MNENHVNKSTKKSSYFGEPYQEELEKLKQQNKSDSFLKKENDRLADRILSEVYYRKENEARIKNEIEKIKQNIYHLEQNLNTAKEIQMKKELGDLLTERKALANLEKELYNDILQFKEIYENKKQQNRFISQEDELFLSKNIQTIFKKKEQIDFDRLRMSKNLEKTLKGDFHSIQRNQTNLLREEQTKVITANVNNLLTSDSSYLQSIIRNSTDKIKELRVFFLFFNFLMWLQEKSRRNAF